MRIGCRSEKPNLTDTSFDNFGRYLTICLFEIIPR